MSKILTKLKKEEIDEIENYSERMNSLKALALAFETDEVFSKKCDMYERLIKDISDTNQNIRLWWTRMIQKYELGKYSQDKLNMVLAFAIISKLGVETTSFAALLASAGVAVGMALSGNLSNFAGGLIILVFKPFKVGDYIDGPGVSGTIKEIQIFHTILSTLDNRMIYVPNGMLSGNAVINYSKQEMRRVEWVFGVEYGEDVQRVRTVLQRIIYADKRILDTPAPIIVLGSLSASSVDITVRVWVKTADYWNVLYDINEIVYTTFNKEGIGFPFPQLTVHQSSK